MGCWGFPGKGQMWRRTLAETEQRPGGKQTKAAMADCCVFFRSGEVARTRKQCIHMVRTYEGRQKSRHRLRCLSRYERDKISRIIVNCSYQD